MDLQALADAHGVTAVDAQWMGGDWTVAVDVAGSCGEGRPFGEGDSLAEAVEVAADKLQALTT